MATVTVLSDVNFRTTVLAGNHELMADEPAGIGDDCGPSPYEFLLGALGSCTSMTLLIYARRKNWPLDGVEIELSHDREYEDDNEATEDPTKLLDVIRRNIKLHGPLTDEQQSRLTYIATRCPVHKTLLNAPRIVDEVSVTA
jgi:putative redox protein